MTQATLELANKIRWRIAMPTILFMFISSLDRANISFAAITMRPELGLSEAEYGLASSLVFVGFLAGQVPSILLMQKVGFKRWLALVAVVWGLTGMAMSMVQDAGQLYALRILLGFAEGGLAPGIVLYLSQFATERERASTFATPMLAIPFSLVLGGPISGLLLEMDAPFGLSSWRWMFLAEGLPAVVLGLAALAWFPDRPGDAKWLSETEKTWLSENSADRGARGKKNDWSVLLMPLTWVSSALWFCLLAGAYGIMFWLPVIVDQLTGMSPLRIGIISALPWVGVGLGIYFNSIHSDRTGERFWHVGLPAALCALFIAATVFTGASVWALLLLFLIGLGLGAAQGTFWAMPTALFPPSAMAMGVVAINIAGTSGGLVTPTVIGLVRENSDGFFWPIMLISGVMLLAALLVVLIRLVFFGKGENAA